ncbi:hypothetical protein HZA43_03485 [Candidatus Peregrinibacteria bacterium]|nr:hypothetical protein [Candidatus Peregrinibacteria bacterium]
MNQKKNIINGIFAAFLSFFLKAHKAAAFGINDFRSELFKPINLTGIKSTTLGAAAKITVAANFFINLILYASGGLAVLLLIIGAIQYISSFGQQEGMDRGKKTIQYALLGLLAVITAYFIVTNLIKILYSTAG